MITGGADSKIHPLQLRSDEPCTIKCRSWQGEPGRSLSSRSTPAVMAGSPAKVPGILILEEHDHAVKRGAKIYGESPRIRLGLRCHARQGGLDRRGVQAPRLPSESALQ